MIKVVKEAYTDTCRVVCDPEYVTIEHFPTAAGIEPVHMSTKEAREVVEWLSHELNRVLPEIIPYKVPVSAWDVAQVRALENLDVDKMEISKDKQRSVVLEPVYDPGPRTATQTVEVKVGDPNLAYKHTGGRTSAPGDGDAGVMDLGAQAAKVGKL